MPRTYSEEEVMRMRGRIEPPSRSELGHSQTSLRLQLMSAFPPKADIPSATDNARFVPLPASCIAANCASFDNLVGTGERDLLGQPRFPKTLDDQLQV